MLQAIRSRAATWVVKVLFVLLIISFGAWGIADYINRGGRATHVATVGDQTIEPQRVNQALTEEIQRLRQMLGPTFDREQARQFGIVDSVLDGLITRSLVEQEAKRLGLQVSDEGVRTAITSERMFAGPDGQFDRLRFQQLLARAGYTEQRYIAELRQDLGRQHLLTPVQQSARAPQLLAEQVLKFREERRVAMVATIPAHAVPDPGLPSAEQIAGFHRENASRFTAPERRDAQLLLLGPEQVQASVAVGITAIEEAYRQRLREFTTPGRRVVQQLLYADEAAATAAHARLVAGTAIEEVAADAGNLAGADTNLGEIGERDLPATLSGPVFAAGANTTLAPIRSGLGWHVFRVTDVTAEVVIPLEQVRDRIGTELARERAVDRVIQLTNRVEDALASNATLEEVAREVGAIIVPLAGIDRRGLDATGSRAAGLPAGDATLRLVFETAEGRTTQRVIEATRDAIAAVRVDRVVPPTLRPIAEVEDQLIAGWVAQEIDRAVRARAEEVATALRQGVDFATALPVEVAEATVTDGFTRTGTGASLPPALVADLFTLPVGGVAIAAAADGYTVAQLAEITAATPDAETVAQQATNLSAGIGDDLVQQFEKALRQRFPVTIDRRALGQLF